MVNAISRKKIVYVFPADTGYIVFAENSSNNMFLMNISSSENRFIGKFNFARADLLSFYFNPNNEILAILLINGELLIYKYSDILKKINSKQLKSEGVYIHIDETGHFISTFNSHKICSLWKLHDDELIDKKIKETNLDEILMKFNHYDYFYKKIENSHFKIFTPDGSFTIKENTFNKVLDQNLLNEVLSLSSIHNNHSNEIIRHNEKTNNKPTVKKLENVYHLIAESKDRSIIACSKDKESKIDVYKRVGNEFELFETLDKHSGIIKCLYFNPYGTKLFSGSSIGRIKVWEIDNNEVKITETLNCHNCPINQIKTFESDRFLLSLDSKQNLTFWGLKTYTAKTGKKKKKKPNYS